MDYGKHFKDRMTQAEIDSALLAKMDADQREIARLREIEKAARNLVAQKGRHNTETAYKRLADALERDGICS